MEEIEIWKDVVSYEGYYKISSFGLVKSLSRIILKRGKYPFLCEERVLKHRLNRGYPSVTLYKNGEHKIIKIHQLVAEAFLNHTRCGYKLVVDQIDNDRTNNKVNNLRIVTQRINADHKRFKSSSIYTGVSWDEKRNKWVSQITINGKKIFLGRFKNEIEASQHYENALFYHNANLPFTNV